MMSEISRFSLFLAKKTHTKNTRHLTEKTVMFCENCSFIIMGFPQSFFFAREDFFNNPWTIWEKVPVKPKVTRDEFRT